MSSKVCNCWVGEGCGSFPHENRRMQPLETNLPRTQRRATEPHHSISDAVIHYSSTRPCQIWCWHLNKQAKSDIFIHWYFHPPLWLSNLRHKEMGFPFVGDISCHSHKPNQGRPIFSLVLYHQQCLSFRLLWEPLNMTTAVPLSVSVTLIKLKG